MHNLSKWKLYLIAIVLFISVVYDSTSLAKDSPLSDEQYQLDQISQCEKKNGPYSETTQVFVERLAQSYKIQRMHAKASTLFEKALNIARNRLGSDNTTLWQPMVELAMSYDEQGAPEKADPLYLDLLVRYPKWQAARRTQVEEMKRKPLSQLTDNEKEWRTFIDSGGDMSPPDLEEVVRSAAEWNKSKQLKKRVEWIRLRTKK